MTPEVEKKRRELFDAWHRSYQEEKWLSALKEFDLEPEPMPEQFLQAAKLLHWQIWNAALDAVEIELPSKIENSPPYACYEFGRNEMRDEVVHAITATGLGLRIK